MAEPARRPLTYADLLAATTESGPVPELIDGELGHKASPRGTHAYSQGRVLVGVDGVARGGADEPGGGWWILVEPDVVLDGGHVVRPDLAGWRKSTLAAVPSGPLEVRPDWVCEVLSPGHRARDRVIKAALYGRYGVPWMWLLDPDERVLEALQLDGGTWRWLGAWTDGQTVAIPPFEGVEIEVSGLFVPRADEPPLVNEPGPAYRQG